MFLNFFQKHSASVVQGNKFAKQSFFNNVTLFEGALRVKLRLVFGGCLAYQKFINCSTSQLQLQSKLFFFIPTASLR